MTPKANSLIRDIARKVRCLSPELVRDGYFAGVTDPRAPGRTLGVALDAGLIDRHVVLAPPLPRLDRPVATWRPGAPLPDPRAVSRALRSRWGGDPRPTVVYAATPKACRLYGAPPAGFQEPTKVAHDLGLARVYVTALRDRPDVARRWAGERLYASLLKGEKLPDAMILDDRGVPTLVVEFGGAYSANQVKSFAESTRARNLPFELW